MKKIERIQTMIKKMKGVIFDQDGTLYDTEKLYVKSWLEAGKYYHIPIDETFASLVSGMGILDTIEVLKEYFPNADGHAVLDKCFSLCMEKQNEELEEKPGLHEIFDYCKSQGFLLAIASNSPKTQIEKNLEQVGLRDAVSYIVSGESIEKGKPHPDIFLDAARNLGLDPEECYVIEDSFNGIRAGHAAGCTTIMIPDQKQPTEEIRSLYDVCCKDFFEAIEYMKNAAK